jgi:hypothetical protein
MGQQHNEYYCNASMQIGRIVDYRRRVWPTKQEAEFLDEIQTKEFTSLLCHLYSFALRFLFVQTHATSCYFVKEKGGKPDRRPCPLLYVLRNPYRELRTFKKMPETPMKLYVHDFGFCKLIYAYSIKM